MDFIAHKIKSKITAAHVFTAAAAAAGGVHLICPVMDEGQSWREGTVGRRPGCPVGALLPAAQSPITGMHRDAPAGDDSGHLREVKTEQQPLILCSVRLLIHMIEISSSSA